MACVQFGMLDEFSSQIIRYVPILLPQGHPGQLPGTGDQLHPSFQSFLGREAPSESPWDAQLQKPTADSFQDPMHFTRIKLVSP